MFGWFDWFRDNGAPTFYGENRTPVVLDLQIVALLSLFLTPTLAFFIILPGIRQKRFISTLTFVITVALGATIMRRFINRQIGRHFWPKNAVFALEKGTLIILSNCLYPFPTYNSTALTFCLQSSTGCKDRYSFDANLRVVIIYLSRPPPTLINQSILFRLWSCFAPLGRLISNRAESPERTLLWIVVMIITFNQTREWSALV